MQNTFLAVAATISLSLCVTGRATAQSPSPAPLQVLNPHYVSIQLETTVNKPAAEAWKLVGHFCPTWTQNPCTIMSGKDGELGAVRSLGGGEVMVARTNLSYTYTQQVRVGVPYNLYHGTLQAQPVSAKTSKLVYTLVFDNSMLPDDDARKADIERRTMMFTGLLQNMKTFVEGRAPRSTGRSN